MTANRDSAAMVSEAKGHFRKPRPSGKFRPNAESRERGHEHPNQGAGRQGGIGRQVSLVTGSTSGIGLGIARALAEAGSAVVLNGLGVASEIARTKDQLAAEFGVKVGYSAADMTSPAAIAEMIAATLAEHGRLDVLVNNAGIQYVAPLDQFPVEKWDAILSINLSSAFHTTRAALPAIRQNKFGRIINIASAHGLVASLQGGLCRGTSTASLA